MDAPGVGSRTASRKRHLDRAFDENSWERVAITAEQADVMQALNRALELRFSFHPPSTGVPVRPSSDLEPRGGILLPRQLLVAAAMCPIRVRTRRFGLSRSPRNAASPL